MEALKECASKRIFRAWIEDWEKEDILDNDCIAEARLLEKYKNLVFFCPDDQITFTVNSDAMQYHRGSKRKNIDKGWAAICTNANGDEDQFAIPLLNELITETAQADGVQVIFPSFLGSSKTD